MAKISKESMEKRKANLETIKASLVSLHQTVTGDETISGTQKDRIIGNLSRLNTYLEGEIKTTSESIAVSEKKTSKSALLKELKNLTPDELAELKAMREAKSAESTTEPAEENSFGEETDN